MSIEKRVAFITGGARGMGEAFCRAFATLGMAVAIIDVEEEAGIC